MSNHPVIDPTRIPIYRSAFIKSIRRCLVDDAVYWGSVLYHLGHVKAVWHRMLIHCSEDVGIAEPNLPSNIRALYDNFNTLVQTGQQASSIIVYTHAIILLASAQKSRIVDNAVICYYREPLEARPIPDYAFDHHTREGRQAGRDINYFVEESSKLENDNLHDPYEQRAKEILLRSIEKKNAT